MATHEAPEVHGRLTTPLVRVDGVLKPTTWDVALDTVVARARAGQGRPRAGRRRHVRVLEDHERAELRRAEAHARRHRHEQHRQLQPDLTRPFGRRSGGRVRCREAAPRPMRSWKRRTSWCSGARTPARRIPIMFQHMLKGQRNGAHLVVVDPRRTASARWANEHARPPGGLGHRPRQRHGARRRSPRASSTPGSSTTAPAATRSSGRRWPTSTPEWAERETGVPAEQIRRIARRYATADRAIICWTLGITEHHNAVDNVHALINLALLTGHVGRLGSGLESPARAEQRPGRRRHGRGAAPPARLPGRLRSGQATPVRGALGRAPLVDAGPQRDRDAGGRRRGHAPRPLRHRREPGRVRRGHAPRGEGARTARPPGGRGSVPHADGAARRTSCCRPRPAGARRKAR